jgi:hypothetical protein
MLAPMRVGGDLKNMMKSIENRIPAFAGISKMRVEANFPAAC